MPDGSTATDCQQNGLFAFAMVAAEALMRKQRNAIDAPSRSYWDKQIAYSIRSNPRCQLLHSGRMRLGACRNASRCCRRAANPGCFQRPELPHLTRDRIDLAEARLQDHRGVGTV